MKEQDELKDNIFNSKIEKVFIEVHDYSFCHTSSSDNNTATHFLGRKELVTRLKNLITNSSTKSGVYLVTGNRGVGKSSLVSNVVKKTTVGIKEWNNSKYLLTLLGTIFCLQIMCKNFTGIYQRIPLLSESLKSLCFYEYRWYILCGILLLLSLIFFLLLGHNSLFRKKNNNYKKERKTKIKSELIYNIAIGRTILAAIKELSSIKTSSKSPNKRLVAYKGLFIIFSFSFVYFLYPINLSYLQLFVVYISFLGANYYWRYIEKNIFEKIKEKTNRVDINELRRKLRVNYIFFIVTFVMYSLVLVYFLNNFRVILWSSIVFLIVISIVIYCICRKAEENTLPSDKNLKWDLIHEVTIKFIPTYFIRYWENHTRVYLRINLGHQVLNEKDVLRLIARSIQTEFSSFRHSIKRMLIWRITAFSILLILSFAIYKIIYLPELKHSFDSFYANHENSQRYIGDPIRTEMFFKNKKISNYNKLEDYAYTIDKSVNHIYSAVVNTPSYFWNKNQKIAINDHILNYHYIAIFLLAYIGCCFILRLPFFGIMTHRKIQNQLKRLNESITSEITTETGVNIEVSKPAPAKIGGNRSRSRKQFLADEREIEKGILDILDNIQKIPSLMRRPEFIIIFDELDKVEPENRENSIKTKSSMFSLEAIRERQSTILKLLINLKFFLTNANAKFIFIAGREMYDIYLADISDRNNFIGSIFHDVINVPSFLSDNSDEKIIDPTSLTEEFVCQYLTPSSYPVSNYSLKSYAKYLDQEVFNGQNDLVTNLKKEKIIAILQQFIIYLAYLSKGAPKKMVQLFEDFIEVLDSNQLDSRFCIRQYRKSKYFLTFDYQDQYAVGMIAYLINPVFYKIKTSNIQKHSDKLLISTLFMLDYVYKFHAHSFSWRDLNASSEMLEVNKAPELRPMMTDLLNFLSQFHIEKSTSGFNDFKFENLISYEISFLSKIYEEFSAIYNFSLDESLAVRQYYLNLLETEQEYNKKCSNEDSTQATSSLKVRLGDLYFYDDELEKANVYYKNGVHDLRQNGVDNMDLDQFLFLVKNMLKLGFVYEKRKLYDFAFATFGELCRLLIQIQDSNISNLESIFPKGLHYLNNMNVIKNDKQVVSLQNMKNKNLSSKLQQSILKNFTFSGIKMLYLPLLAKFQIKERSHFGGNTDDDLHQLIREFEYLSQLFDNKQHNLLVADFYSKVAEILYYKNKQFVQYSNLTKDDNLNSEENLSNDGSCSVCHFYKKALIALLNLTDIGTTDKTSATIEVLLKKTLPNLEKHNELTFCNTLARILSDWGNVFFSCDRGKSNSCLCKKNDCILSECTKLTQHCPKNTKEINISTLDNIVSFIDKGYTNTSSIISCDTKFEVAMTMYSISANLYKRSGLHKRSSFQINKILLLVKNYISDYYLKEADIHRLIYFIEESKVLKILAHKSLHSIYLAYDDLNILEINRKKDIFDPTTATSLKYLPLDSKIDRFKISIKEIELKMSTLDEEKRLKYLKKHYQLNDDVTFITSKYEINYSVSARIYRLRLKTNMNWEIFKGIIDIGKYKSIHFLNRQILDFILDKSKKHNEKLKNILDIEDITNLEVLERILADTLFCYNEIIKLSKTSGESYFFNHSFLAGTYKKMSDWVILYEAYDQLKQIFPRKDKTEEIGIKNTPLKQLEISQLNSDLLSVYNQEVLEIVKELNMSKIENYLKSLIGEEWREQLSGHYATSQALAHYYKCIETHTGGQAYYSMIDKLYYVRDDYNDRVTHFDIAQERALIITGKIKEHKDILKSRYKESKIHDIDNYFK